MALRIMTLLVAAGLAGPCFTGCFYPPISQPNTQTRDQIILPLPYDLAWDAVLSVIKKNDFKVHAEDPTHGIVEAETNHFTLADADCGVVGTAVGKVAAEPNTAASAVFNFYVAAQGREASAISIQAVFATPTRVPFHPVRDVECVSRGVQEARLLNEIKKEAEVTHRPVFKKPTPSS